MEGPRGTGCVTIFLGLSLEVIGKNIALVLSAIVTALNGWDAFVKYETRANQEHSISSKLTTLYKDILLLEAGNEDIKEEKYKEFESRYHQVQDEYLEERRDSPDGEPKNDAPKNNA